LFVAIRPHEILGVCIVELVDFAAVGPVECFPAAPLHKDVVPDTVRLFEHVRVQRFASVSGVDKV
jgi:hypothetical protein